MDTQVDFSPDELQFDSTAKPLYVQIEGLLRDMMLRGVFKKGDLLPPIGEIAKKLGVNRITVRRAMQALASEGLVASCRGRGTVMLADYGHYPKMVLKTKLASHMSFTTGSKIRLLISERCDSSRCQTIPEQERHDSYQRLLHLNSKENRPFGYVELFIASHMFDAAPSKFAKKLALRATVAFLGKEAIAGIRQRVTIGSAAKDAAAHLKIPVGSPVANIHRVVKDIDNKAVYVGNIVYSGELIEFLMDMDID